MSQEGYERLVDELEKYKVEKVKADEEVREAMAGKDFRENAPLDAAKERQGFVAAKIRELESEVASAQILSGDVDTNSGKRVVVGSSITIKDVGSGKVINYTLVDKREADVKSGKISTRFAGRPGPARQDGRRYSGNYRPKGNYELPYRKDRSLILFRKADDLSSGGKIGPKQGKNPGVSLSSPPLFAL